MTTSERQIMVREFAVAYAGKIETVAAWREGSPGFKHDLDAARAWVGDLGFRTDQVKALPCWYTFPQRDAFDAPGFLVTLSDSPRIEARVVGLGRLRRKWQTIDVEDLADRGFPGREVMPSARELFAQPETIDSLFGVPIDRLFPGPANPVVAEAARLLQETIQRHRTAFLAGDHAAGSAIKASAERLREAAGRG